MRTISIHSTILITFFLLCTQSEAQNAVKPELKFIENITIRATQVKYNQTAVVTESPKEIVSAAPVASSQKSEIEKFSSVQFKYAQKFDMSVEEIDNVPLLLFIEDWWHTRYLYGGKSKRGVDCSGYTGLLHKEIFNNSLPRSAKGQYEATKRISNDEMQMGDLVFFNTTGGVSHVGVYLYNGYFTHSACTNGVTINHLNENYYKKRFIGAGRVIKKSSNEDQAQNTSYQGK
jgi:lipoprotein Spr